MQFGRVQLTVRTAWAIRLLRNFQSKPGGERLPMLAQGIRVQDNVRSVLNLAQKPGVHREHEHRHTVQRYGQKDESRVCR